MIYPSIDKLLNVVDSKYELVHISARRSKEIAKDGYNAFICDDWDKLIEVLNHLSEISCAEYERMAKNSREHYERYFNYEMCKIKYN